MFKKLLRCVSGAACLSFITTLFFIAPVLNGCSEQSEPSTVCSPEATGSCMCPGTGAEGTQVCLADGLEYGACICDVEVVERELAEPEDVVVVEAPDMEVTPGDLYFGVVAAGTSSSLSVSILSTGAVPLQVQGIEIVDEDGEFGIDLASIEDLEEGAELPEDIIFSIDPGDTAVFNISFTPKHGSLTNASGQPIPRVGEVQIFAKGIEEPTEIAFSGLSSNPDCPIPVIVIEEGEQVAPSTTLHLRGDESYSPTGMIAEWTWEVEQPKDSYSVFDPGPNGAGTTFEANVVGEYTFRLRVDDGSALPNCQAEEMTVLVVPDKGIHIELSWDTPEDSALFDEGDEAGTDMDLHVIHPDAGGLDLDGDGSPDGWYSLLDCFWGNPNPQWEELSATSGESNEASEEDEGGTELQEEGGLSVGPKLVRHDTDGWGPEIFAYVAPENGGLYKVGVHFYREAVFESSTATIRMFIDGQLALEVSSKELFEYDMWEVCTIEWPSGEITLIDDGQKVISDYVNPFYY